MSNWGAFRFTTGTATFAIFDPALLQHRCEDADDWWSVPWDEVAEINRGNMLTVALGSDGAFTVHVSREPFSGTAQVQALIACASGQIYMGAGEQLPGGGLAPSDKYGGRFIQLPHGTYFARLVRTAHDKIALNLERVEREPRNHFEDSPALKTVVQQTD